MEVLFITLTLYLLWKGAERLQMRIKTSLLISSFVTAQLLEPGLTKVMLLATIFDSMLWRATTIVLQISTCSSKLIQMSTLDTICSHPHLYLEALAFSILTMRLPHSQCKWQEDLTEKMRSNLAKASSLKRWTSGEIATTFKPNTLTLVIMCLIMLKKRGRNTRKKEDIID